MRNLVIGVALLLSACASAAPHQQWQKVGSNADRVAQDFRECNYEAEKASAPAPAYGNVGNALGQGMVEGFRTVHLREMCMEVRGYARVQ